MIRVLHIVTYMGRGGLETMIMNYYRHIDRKKIQFDFLVHREFEADYDKEIESLGGRIYRIQKLNPFSNKYKKSLRAFFLNHPEYKIVHVHQDCLSSVVLKIAKQCNIPVRIAHSHSKDQIKDMRYPIKLYYRRFISKYATFLFACGKEAGDWMFCGSPYRILSNAIDVDQYSFNDDIRVKKRRLLGLDENDVVIGHVGSFYYPKNHEFLIDVFREIHNDNKKVKLILVGEGPQKTHIENKVKALGLEKNVIFTGVCKDVPEIMQSFDLFIFPSIFEGLGIVAIEAQAAGLPCFISDGVPDEAMITNLAIKIPLSKGAKQWADIILRNNYARKNTKSEIIKAGFDILDNAQWLQEFYLDKLKEEA